MWNENVCNTVVKSFYYSAFNNHHNYSLIYCLQTFMKISLHSMAHRVERNLHESVFRQMKINKLQESLCIKLPIEHTITCDSRANLNYIVCFTEMCRFIVLYIVCSCYLFYYYRAPHISIGETVLKSVEQFTYLGCAISSNARIDGEIDNRLAKANNAFGRLYKRVWNNKHLRIITKISVYRAVVLTTLLYGSESWVTYRNHLKLLERFHQRCRRTILNIHWSDYITNIIVLERADITSIEAMLLKIQLRWAGHVAKMEDHRLPKIILYGELSSGLRNRGAPKKRYKDILKKSLGACNISHLEWTTLAEDRSTWRRTISKAASSFESSRRSAIEEKHQRRKNSAAVTPNPDETFTCCHYNRTCRSRIGLIKSRACLQETWTSST